MPPSRLAIAVLAALALAGCYGQVQRTLTIESEPEGARCWLNDNEVGRTPVTVPFTWYGTYNVRLEHAGYEPLIASAKVKAPHFQWIPLDLAYETVVPGVHRDAHAFQFTMSEVQPTDVTTLRERAEGLRRQGGLPAMEPIMEPSPTPEERGDLAEPVGPTEAPADTSP